jgi:glycerol-3-phosphate dehydrogenase
MRLLETEVLVIGGGATGTGVLRDLAMRGLKAVLVEKGDLTHGTTGRYHGLLHSGGRYVVKDPQAAKDCIEENHILRYIMPHCVEDTGGFFVITPWDNPDYAPRFLTGCLAAGIPVEDVPIAQMLREEPLLNPNISQCFRVPDASADSFLAADSNAESAREYGATVLNYHKVTGLLRKGDRAVGAQCYDLVLSEDLEIHANLIINASGAWAGQVTGMLGIKVHVIPGKGTMIAMNHRIVNTVINRCKMPSDGDILVPTHTVSVIGTTDVMVENPDHFAIEPWEVHLMLEEGDKLVPGFKDMRMLRAWAGVRPLHQETEINDTRDITRSFVLLDHGQRDGLEGFITITSGKWTTYRKMAEATVDLACQKLGVQRPCRTHLEPLPESKQQTGHYLGMPLAHIEKNAAYGQLICECELVSSSEVERAINTGAKTIDDVRRDVRLGMGPCQGGFCTYRVAGLLHKLRHSRVEDTNVALRDFLQERWKGLLPILWGQQLRQERLTELIYIGLLNADHLPGPHSSPLSPELYEPPAKPSSVVNGSYPILGDPSLEDSSSAYEGDGSSSSVDVLVVGAGLSGLTAAWQATTHRRSTHLITKGLGAIYWNSGCIDVLGYYPIDNQKPVTSPHEALSQLIQDEPTHPYSLAGLDNIIASLQAFQELCAQSNYPLFGDIGRNWMFPTALGTFRPTCLAPETMIAGDIHQPGVRLIIGFKGYPDFYPDLIAANLVSQGVPAIAMTLELPSLQARRFITGRTLAEQFEKTEFRTEVITAIQTSLRTGTASKADRIGFPAVLGLSKPLEILHDLQSQLGLPIFEIPTLPPSIPGIRLSNLLIASIENSSGRFFDGMLALSSDIDDQGCLSTIWSEAASRRKRHRAFKFILATGGILGGGLKAHYEGNLKEVICDLPIKAHNDRNKWLQRQFLSPQAHPIFKAGIVVNHNFQPLDSSSLVIYKNLYATGTGLSGGDYIRQRSFDGVALVTGYTVGRKI